MIIQSDNISMEASRHFSSTQAAHTRYSSGKVHTITGVGFGRRNSSTVSRNDHPETEITQNQEKTAEGAPEGTEKETHSSGDAFGANNLNNLMEQMNGTYSVQRAFLQDNIDAFNRIQRESINYLIYILFGQKNIGNRSPAVLSSSERNSFSQVLNRTVSKSDALSGLVSGGNGEYYSSFYYSEEETTCFEAKGTAVTADGRKIPFGISLEMSRSFTETAQQQIQFHQPQLCDPLVINLDNNATSVIDQKFLFDIDADGTKDSVSMLNSGCGYLALDKNNDGIVNDGTELFGAKNGNGFRDLAAYDIDKNGWIDEADEIFQKLRIWTRDAYGKDQLLTLKEAGVGAIYLGYKNTDFSLNRREDNRTDAVIRRTGIFLYENGRSGIVQQLDLVKNKNK